MKTIIAGSRTIQSYAVVLDAITRSGFADAITEVFSGMATGPDIFGYRWATERKIPVRRFVPEWSKYGKVAGIIRNCEMITFADAAIFVWDGKSSGTAHAISYCKQMDPPLKVFTVVWKPETQTLVEYGREQAKVHSP